MQENRIRLDFGWKSFISLFGSRLQARTCEKFWKKYILKIHNYYIHLRKQALYYVNIFWKSNNFMFNSNSRPWKCKRTEFESILVEKVSFHFLVQGCRRGLAKSSEKNIFWKSTNTIYFENPQMLCSIATAGHENAREQNWNVFWLKKFHFIFWLKAASADLRKVLTKNIFWKSTNFMSNCNSRPSKWKRTELESILVEKVSFHFLAQGRRRGPAKSSEKIYFENPQILCSIATAGPENANEQHSNRFWLKKFHFIFGL